MVGVSRRSYLSKRRLGCSAQASRSNHACTYWVGPHFIVRSTISASPGSRSARRSGMYGASRAAMLPQKIVRKNSFGLGQPGSTSSSRQPKSRKRLAALWAAARTSGSSARLKPRSAVHATRRPRSEPRSAFT